MKSARIPGMFILAATLWIAPGCDIIEDPVKTGTVDPEGDEVYRKVLIEDFTGHRCKNCPDASETIKQLKSHYGDQVVALGIHAGPSQFVGVSTDYPTDFTTPAGDSIGTFFNVPLLPIGMICRQDYTGSGNSHFKVFSSWPPLTESLYGQIAIADMTVTAEVSAGELSTTVTTIFVGDQIGDFKIATFVKEDHIVAPQLMPDHTRNPTYVHNNVMRKSLAGAFGENLVAGAIADSTVFTNAYTTPVDSTWNAAELSVVSYIYDAATYEVMQVAEAKAQ